MLLYDRVFEAISLLLRRWGEQAFNARLNNTESVIWTGLRQAVVYEISDVAGLFKDWETESKKAIPRTPPHDALWTEWHYEDMLGSFKLGCLIQKGGSCADWLKHMEKTWHTKDKDVCDSWEEMLRIGGPDSSVWDARVFRYLEGFAKNAPAGYAPEEMAELYKCLDIVAKKVTADPGVFYFILSGDGTKASPFAVRFPATPDADGIFNFPQWGPLAHEVSDDPFEMPWQPFMAFALLHCKNIVTEENVPDEKTQRRVAKAGNPPRVTYKTLKIEVPASAHRRGRYEGDEDDSGPKVRWHICSGHVRHLTSERFTNKRDQFVWIPAHAKGSKELGEVHKRYALKPKPDGKKGT